MIFHRSHPPHFYDYRAYKPFLRIDFQHRCAYCLTHEYFLGGEAGCVLDHHRPVHGPFGRPDLKTVYANLYLCCCECNTNKSDIWSDENSYAHDERFIDPCEEWGDHDLHWRFETDGTLTPLTPEGIYTNDILMLWREFLVDRRAQQYQDQLELDTLYQELAEADLPETIRMLIETRLAEISKRLHPPVFNKPHRA